MTALHPDFGDLRVTPGESHITDRHELFSMLNLVEFGGAADRPTHVPAILGSCGPVQLWESTGAADQLPFWNTNEDGDAWLYIVHGAVRVEFKETRGPARYGHQEARTGDLFRLPPHVAHRTFSGDGRRRITLEVMPRNPHWDLMGARPVPDVPGERAGSFTFDLGAPEHAVVTWPGGSLQAPRALFLRALRALVAYELHLGINELDGGLVVHDHGETVTLSAGDFSETLDGMAVTGAFRSLVAAHPV